MERLRVSSILSLAVAERPIPQLANAPTGGEQTTHAPDSEDDSCLRPDSQGVWPRPPNTGQFIFRLAPGGFNVRIVTPITSLAVHRAWELLVSRSYLGWKIVFQPLVHFPDDVFLQKLARAGAIDDLQHLFQSQQVVVRDDADFHNDLLLVRIPYIFLSRRMLVVTTNSIQSSRQGLIARYQLYGCF
jgi:hypothetical protein